MPFYALLVLLGVMFNAANANAALCVEDNTAKCKQLGYTESSCPYGGVACLYDKTLWYCAKWSCADGRYSSSSLANHDCLEVGYKGLTCYDCQPKIVCAENTYETKELCETNANKTCVINSQGCYAPKTSNCPPGQYESSEECIAENKSAKKCKQDGATKCYKPLFSKPCPLGLYETRAACKQATGALCIQDGTCWKAAELLTCLDYPLTACPSQATCSKCNTDASKLKFDSCNVNYYNTGTDTSPTCTSCRSAQANMNQLNTIAKLSYLNCCSGGRFITCRQGRGDCTNTSRYGSWDDGCLPYKDSSINNLKDYDDVYALKQACINTMQEITDKINDFNEKCPNYKIKNVVSPSTQCGNIIVNGTFAAPSYNSYGGCPSSDDIRI